MLRKISFEQNKRHKKCTLVLSRNPFSKPSCFYHSLHFCSIKSMDSLTLKCNNSFQNKNNKKVTHSFAPSPLIFKLYQED